jgi:hypothetical protein
MRAEHDRIIDEAEALGVFDLPIMVFQRQVVLRHRPHRHADRAHQKFRERRSRARQPAAQNKRKLFVTVNGSRRGNLLNR